MIKTKTKIFFNDKRIFYYINKAERKVLGNQGAHLRKEMRNSMRQRTGKKSKHIASPPGTPPYFHVRGGSGFSLRSRIFFRFDVQSRSVVIGVEDSRNKIGELHDKGGVRRIRVREKGQTKTVSAVYPARPFTMPALVKAQPKLAEFWRDQISPQPKPFAFSMISL